MSDTTYILYHHLIYPAFWVSSSPVVLHEERVMRPAPFILASTHLSEYDSPLLMASIGRNLDFLSITEFVGKPFAHWFLRQMNCFFVDRQRTDLAGARTALQRLQQGRVVAMFPEGRIRKPSESVLAGAAFKPGVAKMAHLADVPVVPVVILGGDAYHRVLNWAPLKRVRYGVNYGHAIYLRKELGEAEARNAMLAELRQSFLDLNAELLRELPRRKGEWRIRMFNWRAPEKLLRAIEPRRRPRKSRSGSSMGTGHDGVAPANRGASTTAVNPDAADVLVPHPPMQRYYDGAEQKSRFVRQIFDQTAGDYDRIERLMALGSGPWYRRQALLRAGLQPAMHVLDVAAGTGLVAREAARIVGPAGSVTGVDPSLGMLAQARRTTPEQGSAPIRLVAGLAERLPHPDATFDLLSMGFALRHVSDITPTFGEYLRVLKPGGTLCVLELTRPRWRMPLALLRWYMRDIIPRLTRPQGARPAAGGSSRMLWEYYWDTIENCIRPETVLQAMSAAGFVDVRQHVELGIFFEYTARKPASGDRSEAGIKTATDATEGK